MRVQIDMHRANAIEARRYAVQHAQPAPIFPEDLTQEDKIAPPFVPQVNVSGFIVVHQDTLDPATMLGISTSIRTLCERDNWGLYWSVSRKPRDTFSVLTIWQKVAA